MKGGESSQLKRHRFEHHGFLLSLSFFLSLMIVPTDCHVTKQQPIKFVLD